MKADSTTDIGRRAFLGRAAWAMTAAAMGGAIKAAPAPGESSLVGFVAPKLERIRVAVIGTGGRGGSAVHRLCRVPGVEVVALCELDEVKAKRHQRQMKKNGFKEPQLFIGPEAYKRLCESGLVDAVHINTNWTSHAEIALYSLKCAIHSFVEVPGVRTLDEAWAVVETAEKNRCHCMMLSNCCYDEDAMTLINAAHSGILGELMHGESCYLHETRDGQGQAFLSREKIFSSLAALIDHTGMCYCVHPLAPLSLAMNINRGDRLDYLVSVGSKGFAWQEFARRKFGPDAPVSKISFEANDFNTTTISTVNGKTIVLRQCNNCPMPYTRFYSIYGFNGTIATQSRGLQPSMRVAIEKTLGGGVKNFLEGNELDAFKDKYRSALWKKTGNTAKKVGGHGGMDYLMDLRWSHCIRNGLPLDMSVYDFATWSSIFELSERSVRNRSQSQDIPDFTRGAWKTTPSDKAMV